MTWMSKRWSIFSLSSSILFLITWSSNRQRTTNNWHSEHLWGSWMCTWFFFLFCSFWPAWREFLRLYPYRNFMEFLFCRKKKVTCGAVLTIFSVNNKTKIEVASDPHKKQHFSYNPQILAYIHYNLKNTSSKGPIYQAILTVRKLLIEFFSWNNFTGFFLISFCMFTSWCFLIYFLATGNPP